MAGKPGRSGRKPLSIAMHLLRNNRSQARVLPLPQSRPVRDLSDEERKWILQGVSAVSRRLAESLFATYTFEPSDVIALRNFLTSCDRLNALHAKRARATLIHSESRNCLRWRAALHLEDSR
jgi:hypothetical protein